LVDYVKITTNGTNIKLKHEINTPSMKANFTFDKKGMTCQHIDATKCIQKENQDNI
jgi:hypothetical protein